MLSPRIDAHNTLYGQDERSGIEQQCSTGGYRATRRQTVIEVILFWQSNAREKGGVNLATIGFSSVFDSINSDYPVGIINLIQDTIDADSQTVTFVTSQFPGLRWPGVLGQTVDMFRN
jgi:hypothetical protein